MPRRVGTAEQLSAHQAGWRLAVLAAWMHYEQPVRKLHNMMETHRQLGTPAVEAYGDVIAVLGEIGLLERAQAWVRAHPGWAARWPTAESEAMRARVVARG